MKRKVRSLFFILVCVATLPACAAGYPPAYSAEAIEAKVIDAETKQPLEGVIVTADWELRGGPSPGGSTAVGYLMVMEAVTDRNGRFHFQAWDPIRQSKGELHNRDPRLILFKSGYRYEILSNKSRFEAEAALEPVRRSDWNGKTIELKPFKGTMEEYARHLGSINNDLYPLLGSETCDWKKVPRLLLALTEQSRTFRKLGIDSLYDADLYLPVSERKCGSPKVFFEAYRP